jgi:hypothetical protein
MERLYGGSPQASINPGEITAIAWALPVPIGAAYTVNLRIDNLRFIAP